MSQYLWLIPWGVVIGAYGTLIGAGGGFILVPFLILFYPREDPDVITSISLAVVFFNALSGSAAYARMRRIDFRSALLFSAAAVPGAVLGALTTPLISRQLFDAALGSVMVLASVYLLLPLRAKDEGKGREFGRGLSRHIVDSCGEHYSFAYDPRLGLGLSTAVGFVSSLLGIGGGIIHVPVLVRLLHFPVHIATATSHLILAVMALAGTVVHIATGAFHRGTRRTIVLAIGVLIGAQLGAWLSSRIHRDWIVRGLSAGLCFLGVRILYAALRMQL